MERKRPWKIWRWKFRRIRWAEIWWWTQTRRKRKSVDRVREF